MSFSDDVVRKKFPKVMDDDMHLVPYLAHLRGHAERFHRILRKCGAKIPGVMLLFDYEKGKYDASKSDQLVAVPAAKDEFFHKTNILPGIVKDKEGKKWTDYVYTEILKMITEKERSAYMQIKYAWKGYVISAATGGVVGGGIGATVGAVAATEVGAIVAGSMGAKALGVAATAAGAGKLVAGVAVAGPVAAVGAITVVVAWGIIQEYRKKENEKKLKETISKKNN